MKKTREYFHLFFNSKERFKLSFPILLDTEGVVPSYYGTNAIPATFLIDRAGYLYAAALGARDWGGEDAFLLIKHLLDDSKN
jgi:hypothetical protein